MMGCQAMKEFDDTFSRFDTTPERQRHTNRLTNGRTYCETIGRVMCRITKEKPRYRLAKKIEIESLVLKFDHCRD